MVRNFWTFALLGQSRLESPYILATVAQALRLRCLPPDCP
jgi:hypothetical protein